MIETVLLNLLILTSLVLLIGVTIYGIKKGWSLYLRLQVEMQRNWRWVPPPNYRCSRGKQTNCKYGDYW